MKQVWKYDLLPKDWQSIWMPEGAEMLTVQNQHGDPKLWALVDPSAPQTERIIRVAGTGHDMKSTGTYIGTYQMFGGDLMFHVFEISKETES